MADKGYCETCDLYTMIKETKEKEREVWYCPVCEGYKTHVNTDK